MWGRIVKVLKKVVDWAVVARQAGLLKKENQPTFSGQKKRFYEAQRFRG